jgi:hypothetical protein
MTTSFSRGFSAVSLLGALAVPTMRFWRVFTSAPSIRLRPKVYVFGISFVTASRLRFGAMTTNHYEVEEKWMGEGDLKAKPSEFKPLFADRNSGVGAWGSPRVGPLFIVRRRPIISRLTRSFTFLPRQSTLSTANYSGAARVFSRASVSMGRPWEFRSPLFALQGVWS